MLVKWVHLLWKHTCIISCSPALELRQTISSSLFADKNFPLLPFRAILPCYVENKTTFIHIRIKIWSHFPVTNSNSYVFHAKHIYHMKKFVLLVMVLFWGVFSKACVCEHSPNIPNTCNTKLGKHLWAPALLVKPLEFQCNIEFWKKPTSWNTGSHCSLIPMASAFPVTSPSGSTVKYFPYPDFKAIFVSDTCTAVNISSASGPSPVQILRTCSTMLRLNALKKPEL